jgi:WhiB family redox-sensing transcriptional regulator
MDWAAIPHTYVEHVIDIFSPVEPPEWQDSALCAQADPEAWFPEKGGSTREAKRICQGCEVKAECLDYALDHGEHFGIWGGLSEHERRKLKRPTAHTPKGVDLEVVRLTAAGQPAWRITEELAISTRTVQRHRSRAHSVEDAAA